MNTIYRIVWNTAARKWVVASELAKGRTKPSSRVLRIATAVALVTLGGTAFAATATDVAMASGSQTSCTSNLINGVKNATPTSCVAGKTAAVNAVALSTDSVADRAGTVVGTERQIANV